MKNAHNNPPKFLLSAPEAAAALSISRAHFLRQVSSGKIGPLPLSIGRRVLWRAAELKAWVDGGCVNREQWLKNVKS